MFCAPRSAISPWVMIFCFFFMYDCQVKTASRKVKIFHWSVLKIVRKDLWHTNSIFGECMGGWVEEIEKSYHRVLLGLLGKDSQRKLETMYPFRNLWKALRIFPATKMRFLKWLFLKLTTKWFENPVKESIVHFFRRARNWNFT